jgi:ribonuclease BN (tRNA processing enzyme)
MVDAGTIGAALRLDEQRRIRHILLSHLHFDHVQGLPTLADNLVDDAADSVELIGTVQVIGGLRRYLFNDKVYPNFMALPHPKRPIFKTRTFKPGQETEVGELRVTPIRVNHLVPTVGFLVREGASSFLYSGDTHETEQIWKIAASEPTLKAVFIEGQQAFDAHAPGPGVPEDQAAGLAGLRVSRQAALPRRHRAATCPVPASEPYRAGRRPRDRRLTER